MTPYGSLFYFGLLLYVAIGILVARLCDVRARHIIAGATLLMLVVQYGSVDHGLSDAPLRSIGRVFGFAVVQWVVAALFVHRRASGKHQPTFYVAVVLALLPLAFEKFSPGNSAQLVAFVGISYTTFRALDVIFCIQDGLIKDLPPLEFLSFLLFFPTISAGPIDRYRRFRADYRRERSRPELLSDLDAATERILRGVLYGFVIGPLIDFYWLQPVTNATGLLAVVSYMYAYSIHLFFDFAGYSAFAIGVSYLVGVHSPENFNRPFMARNIADFWNRWHMTLSGWLRDHVYGRFVLAATKGRWFKDRHTAGYLGSALAFGLMGLWHGTALHYLVYGLYHALLVVGYGVFTRPDLGQRIHLSTTAARLLTFHLVCFGFLIFSGRLF